MLVDDEILICPVMLVNNLIYICKPDCVQDAVVIFCSGECFTQSTLFGIVLNYYFFLLQFYF